MVPENPPGENWFWGWITAIIAGLGALIYKGLTKGFDHWNKENRESHERLEKKLDKVETLAVKAVIKQEENERDIAVIKSQLGIK